jgi:hypothetical protein
MRFGSVFLAALLGLVVVTATAFASRPVPAAAAAWAYGSKANCKGAMVPVTVGKKTTCKPLAKAIPLPKATDLRLAYLQQALKTDPAKAVSGKKRKRARTLQSGFGAAGKRAQKKLLKVLPKALAFIDRRGGKARSSRTPGAPALASAGCQPGPAGPTGQTGGATIGALGDNGGYVDAPVGNGLRVKITFVSCGGVSNFRIPECPTANGSVDTSGSGEFRATIEVWEGNRFVSRNSSTFEDKAKVHGEVGPDAKLRFIEVEHSQEMFVVASGGIVIRGGVTRTVRIDMPAGKYNPAGASVRFFGADRIPSDSGAGAFASTAEAAIRTYRAAEPRWSEFKPPYCAEPVFTPDSNTLKLSKGKTGQLGIYAKAEDGGTATAARWTLLSPENASFTPTSSQDPAPSVSYTVTNAPSGGQIKVTVKFTSTAGVGEKAWTQPTEESAPESFAGTISGTAAYDSNELGEGNSVQADWGGSLELRLQPPLFPPGFPGAPAGTYEIASGSINYSFSGSLNGCSVQGSGPIDLPSQPDLKGGSALVLYEGTPRTYNYVIPMPITTVVGGTASGCKDPEDDGSIEWFPGIGVPAMVAAPLPGGPVGSDWSITGSGSGNGGPGTPEQTWQWTLTPKP